MGRFIRGDIVVVPFPFSDLTQTKKLTALVLVGLDSNDLILCQITSQYISDTYAILLADEDFQYGGLKQVSNIRPNRLFTADEHIVLYKAG